MKTLRFIGMAITAVIMSVNFAACSSDDDEDIDISQLEGAWGMIRDEGFMTEDGEREEWDDQYQFDPANPTSECEKIIISKGSDNIFTISYYDYGTRGWYLAEQADFTLDGNTLIPVDSINYYPFYIVAANSNELILEIRGVDESGEYYQKTTYKPL